MRPNSIQMYLEASLIEFSGAHYQEIVGKFEALNKI